MSSNLTIGIIQTNIAATIAGEFPMIKKAPTSDIFLRIIYITIPIFLAITTTMVQILDASVTRYVSDNRTRFSDLIVSNNFCHTDNREQLAIKGKRNIDLAMRNTVLRLSDILYVSSLMINLINITRLQYKRIGVYFLTGRPAELSFNGITFTYMDNIMDQFMLHQFTKQLIFRIAKHITNLKIQYSPSAYLSYQNVVTNAKNVTNIEGV